MYANGILVGLSYVKEVTRGVTPDTPTMKSLRATSRNINLEKNSVTSAERRTDRQIADMRHASIKVTGSVGYELCAQAHDDMLAAAIRSAFASVTQISGVNMAAAATANTITRATGSFITDNIQAGMTILAAGFATGGNNGRHLVINVTATVLTVASTLATDASASGVTIDVVGKVAKVGTTLDTFTFERRFTDVAKYQQFVGVAVNQMSFSIQPDQMVSGSIDLIGMGGGEISDTSLGSPVAAASNSPLVSFDGAIYADGEKRAVVTGLDFTINNNRSVVPVVGSIISPDVFEGQAVITGTVTAFFADVTEYNLFRNETDSQMGIKLNDINGTDFLSFMFPRLKFSAATMDPPQNGPVTLSMPFSALYDSVTGTSITIQRGNT